MRHAYGTTGDHLMVFGLMIGVFLAGCACERRPVVEQARTEIPLGLDLYLPSPAGNPITEAGVKLGRRLFFDPVLSEDRSISCASCHRPERSFTDQRRTSIGVFGRNGPRNAPSLVNRVYGESQFWDGRSSTLEQQALEPITARTEMGMTVERVLRRLRGQPSYLKEFQAVFGRAPDAETVSRALASYVRTILSGDAPIDRFLNGEQEALSEQAERGFRLFLGRANCTACHHGPNFSDERFHNTGTAWRDSVWLDEGRFAVTGRPGDHGAFKTPTLRDVARTAPYMHDGSLATLEDVIVFYDRGGRQNPYLDAELRPLNLAEEEKHALLAFLNALTGTVREGS